MRNDLSDVEKLSDFYVQAIDTITRKQIGVLH